MRIAVFGILLLLSGCATTLKVTYDSVPSGAIIYLGDKSLGYGPVKFEYLVQDKDHKNGYITVQAPTAKWKSGATYSPQNPMVFYFSKSFNQEYLFNRPENFPNRYEDAEFGLQLVKKRESDEQKRKSQNVDALVGALEAITPPRTEINQEPEPVRMHCNKSGETTMNCQSY